MISPLSGERNLTMLTDLYQLTMANGYLQKGVSEKRAVFDLFYRGSGGYSYAVAAGLEQAVQYLRDLRFEEKDIAYLRSLGIFPENFLERLKTFRFTGDLTAVPEGTIVFPSEPILTVSAPIFEAQIIETALLTIVNHQTLIATTAARLAACTDAKILEFGLRRAQGPDAGTYGARAAYIGGCRSTSNVLAGEMFGIAVAGTHSHSWVMTFPTELEAFEAYAEIYPDNCLLLVDTYDTLKSGVPNAIKVFDRLKAEGHKPVGIRLDSGDLAYLSREARKMLDAAGHEDCKIFASNDIDERVLLALNSQDAKIDVYGIGGGQDGAQDQGLGQPRQDHRPRHQKDGAHLPRRYGGGGPHLPCGRDRRHLASPHGLPPRADVEAHHFQGFHRERAARRGHQGRRARLRIAHPRGDRQASRRVQGGVLPRI